MELQTFTKPGLGRVRVLERGGEPWFIAKDVCDILGTATRDVRKILDNCDVSTMAEAEAGGRDIIHIGPGLGGRSPLVISEAGLYELVILSRKPGAKAFKRWITHDVLPAIRKHGMYATPATIETMLADPDAMIGVLQALKAERAARLDAEEARARLLHTGRTYTTTEVAKELGMHSAIELNELLHARGVQFKCNGVWLLYSRYSTRGLTEIKQTVLGNGQVVYSRRWTGAGRDFLLQLLA